jgi:adenine/guanine phosphoribosyltransferase-like PRPP-binding protein
VGTKPATPVILFDDFFTSGASLIAAYWRLDEAGVAPTRAFVIGRQTRVQEPKMLEWGTEDLPISQRPLF